MESTETLVLYCRRGHALVDDNVQEFHDQKTGKTYLRCRECQRRYSKNWRETHKEEAKKKARDWMRKYRARKKSDPGMRTDLDGSGLIW